MRELTDDPFYGVVRRYDRCVIDYCLMEDDAPHRGLQSHRDAVLFAMRRAVERSIENKRNAGIMWGREVADVLEPWSYDMDKAEAVHADAAAFLYVPGILRTDRNGTVFYDCAWESDNSGGMIPYWYAFLETPHGTAYTPDDFRWVNAALFPQGTDRLEVCEWSTDWSDYFDAGHEWWGAACWSVYDPHAGRYAVLLASSTD